MDIKLNRDQGFSLIELMIAIAVGGFITFQSYTLYQNSVEIDRRLEVQQQIAENIAVIEENLTDRKFLIAIEAQNSTLKKCKGRISKCPKTAKGKYSFFPITIIKKRGDKIFAIARGGLNPIYYTNKGSFSDSAERSAFQIESYAQAACPTNACPSNTSPEAIVYQIKISQKLMDTWQEIKKFHITEDITPPNMASLGKSQLCGKADPSIAQPVFSQGIKRGNLKCSFVETAEQYKGSPGSKGDPTYGPEGPQGKSLCHGTGTDENDQIISRQDHVGWYSHYVRYRCNPTKWNRDGTAK